VHTRFGSGLATFGPAAATETGFSVATAVELAASGLANAASHKMIIANSPKDVDRLLKPNLAQFSEIESYEKGRPRRAAPE
jgi:hypothetical protein